MAAAGYIIAISILVVVCLVLGGSLAYVALQRDNDEDPADPKIVVPDITGMVKKALAQSDASLANTIPRPGWMKSKSMMEAKGLTASDPKMCGRHFSAGKENAGMTAPHLAGLKEDDPKHYSAEDDIMARFFAAHGNM